MLKNYQYFLIMKRLFFILFLLLTIYTNAQKQNNTPGSDVYVDIPICIDLATDSNIPVTIYFHESDCINCNNYLNYIDVDLKCASDQTFNNALVFDTITNQQFFNMFSDYSVNDVNWNSQSFLDSKPVTDNQHTIIFSTDTNWWVPPLLVVNIYKHYFYFNFNIPYNDWKPYLCTDSIIDFHVYLSIDYDTDEEFWFRVFVKENSNIRIQNWYRGDTHFHGICTQNDAENGLPLESSKQAAIKAGLDWITTTDHSCDFDNYGNNMQQNWQNLGNVIDSLNLSDSSFVFIRGIEASVNNNQNNIVHALVYPNPLQPFSLPYILDGGGDISSTNINTYMLFDSLSKYNAFCYAAHPFAEGNKLSILVNGGVWNLGDSLSPINGQPAITQGTVIWNNLNYNSDIYSPIDSFVFNKNIVGLENMNLNYSLTTTDSDRDPWNVQLQQEPFGFSVLPESNNLHTQYRFTQNMEAYSFILQRGLKFKNTNSNIQNWKMFISAGSDAHGSFNFSNTDYFYGGLNGNVENNTPGSLSTLVFCPNGKGNNGQNILQSLKNGNAILSDGPVVNLVVSSPDSSYIVGNDAELSQYNENNIYININAYTNYYFGDIYSVKIILQTQDTAFVIPITLLNGNYSISLRNLIVQNIPINMYPLGKYFAIRAELETEKIYSSNQSIYYRSNSQKFHSYTNPIWIKMGMLDNIDYTLKNNISIYPNPVFNKLFIKINENFRSNSTLNIYNILGIKIEEVNLNNEDNLIEINTTNFSSGIYYITNNNKLLSNFTVLH